MFALVDVNNMYVSCERVFLPSLIGRPVSLSTAMPNTLLRSPARGVQSRCQP